MNRHQRLYAQVFRREAPRFVKRALWRDLVKNLPRVKKKCDYCEAYGITDDDGNSIWHSRVTLKRLPNGLFICGDHGTVKERQESGFLELLKRIQDKESKGTDNTSET